MTKKEYQLGITPPPQAPLLERALLGALLIETNAYDKISTIISKECFYEPKNIIIFEAVSNLKAKNESVDLLTVAEELTRMNKLNDAGGYVYLSGLTDKVASAVHIEKHAMLIKQAYIKREIINKCAETQTMAYDPTVDVADVIDNLGKIATNISNTAYDNDAVSNSEKSIDSAIDIIDKRINDNRLGIKNGISLGNKKLDEITGRFQAGQLITVAARPSVGKTLTAIQFLMSALEDDKNVLFFSLEMSKEQLVDRMITSYGLRQDKINSGDITDSERALIDKFRRNMKNKKLHISDKPGISSQYLIATARNINRKKKVDMIIIDYLQLLKTSGFKNRLEEVTHMTVALKTLAGELKVPIVILAQLNRESAQDGKISVPMMSQLRESGSIEQDSDLVILLHKDNPKDLKQEDVDNGTITQDFLNEALTASDGERITSRDMVIIIEKNRFGPTGFIPVTWGNYCAKMYDFHKSPEYTHNEEFNEERDFSTASMDFVDTPF